MIPKRVQALFDFIDYLYSNKNFFKSKVVEFKELEQLKVERNKFNPNKNYKEKIKYNEVDKTLKEKLDKLKGDVMNPIIIKATELNICNFNELTTLHNWNISEISDLIKNFTDSDIPVILEYKEKYLNFREETNYHFFLYFFFVDLDEILKVLFDYFKETENNEFENFETNTVNVDSLNEAVSLLNLGQSKVSIDLKGISKTTKSNINLYQISNLKSIILSDKGEIHKKTKLENDFVLSNKNVYSEKGEIVKEAINPTDYDLNFYLRLKQIDPLYLITDFLNYHYNKTESKNKFLLHIEYKIISEYFKDNKDQKRIEFIKNWINEKKHFTTPAIPKEWFALTTEEKFLYGFESYKRKFNNDDKDSFIEMESEFLKREIHKFDKKESLEPHELKTLVEFRKLLKYIQNKEQSEVNEEKPISTILNDDIKKSDIYKFIDEVFNSQIEKFFKSFDDYELFKKSLSLYFFTKGKTINKFEIEVKDRTKTPLYSLIHEILNKFQFTNTKKNKHKGLYEICKGLSVYNNVTEFDFFDRLSS